MRSTIYFIAFVLAIAAMRASWVEYGASLDDFLSSRDVVFKGVVQSVRDIDQRPGEQIATIEILEVLKNERKIAEIHKNRTLDIVVPSVKSDIRLAGRFYHDPGVKGIWMLCSTCKNYGMESDREVESLAYEDRIREAIGKPGGKSENPTGSG